ncbi:MAG TPA: zf-TFIIB domain-containing protein [Dehalococcoidia bacterium]
MKCATDHSELREAIVGPVRIDVCETCGGTWYEVDELRVLKDRESFGDYCWIDVDLWRDAEQFRVLEQRGLTCPDCGNDLTTLRYGETKVEIDTCGRCRGIWLDKNEYDEVIAELEKRVNSQTVREYLRDLREEFIEVFAGPENPLSELKDLDRVLYLMQLRFAAERPGLAAITRALRL